MCASEFDAAPMDMLEAGASGLGPHNMRLRDYYINSGTCIWVVVKIMVPFFGLFYNTAPTL